VGHEVPCVAERHLLGRSDWREWTGSWEWWPAHTLLDKRGPQSQVGHQLDVAKSTNHEIVYTGWWPRHRIWQRCYRVGGRRGQAGVGRSWEGSRVELSFNDRGGRRGSRNAMCQTSARESSPGRRMFITWGGTGGMVSGSNDQCSQHHGKEDQDLHQFKEVVERWHRREKKSSRKRKTRKTEVGEGCPGEGRAPDVNSAVQEPNVEWLLAEPEGSWVVESSTIRQPSSGHDRGGLNRQKRQAANTATEKEKMLRIESFPRNVNNQYYKRPLAGSAHICIPEQVVEQALYSQSVKKAPVPDKLSFSAVWLLWKWDKTRLMGLTKSAIRMGRHRAVWKQDGRVLTRKPGKDDYSKLNTYRSISQLSCMGKWLKKLSQSYCQKRPKEEGYWATDNSEAGRGGQPLTQRPSWLTELMQPGDTATYQECFLWTLRQPCQAWQKKG